MAFGGYTERVSYIDLNDIATILVQMTHVSFISDLPTLKTLGALIRVSVRRGLCQILLFTTIWGTLQWWTVHTVVLWD